MPSKTLNAFNIPCNMLMGSLKRNLRKLYFIYRLKEGKLHRKNNANMSILQTKMAKRNRREGPRGIENTYVQNVGKFTENLRHSKSI